MSSGNLANTNFVAIPVNSRNKVGARNDPVCPHSATNTDTL